MLRQGFLFLSESPVARTLVTRAPFARWAARRFVAGEEIGDAIAVARSLNARGMTVSLDYLGESVSSREEATAAADTYIRIIETMVAEGIDGNVSLKLTQMGQDIDEDFLHANVRRVLDRAKQHDMFVRFDMESSDYVQKTLDFFERVREEGYDNCGVVLQSYLYRTHDDAKWASDRHARVRLCKGAYAEPESVAFPEKSDVDANYVRVMKLLLEQGNYPGIATHDEAMIEATGDFAREKGIDASRFEFQMLYGIRRDLQKRIVDEGWRLRIYIGFGRAWYPYFMRRLAERPANVLFLARNIFREGLR